MPDGQQNPSAPTARWWIGPLILAAAFLALLAATWRRWADPLIDFGRELYVPWRLSEGGVLYRDVAYFNGPLAPELNACMFRLFGVSFTTLIWTNVVLTAILVACSYRLLRRGCGQLAATLATLVMLCGFAFSHLLNDGNYNYITPYSHDATLGLLLSIVLLLLIADRRALQLSRLLLSGLLLGCVFLTKGELFLAAAAVACGGLVLQAMAARPARRSLVLGAIGFLLAACAAPVAFALCLSREMPPGEAWLGVCGTWQWIFASDVTNLYRPMSGFDRPLPHLLTMAKSVLATGLILATLACYDYHEFATGKKRRLWIVIAALLGCVAALRGRGFPLLIEGEPLLVVSVLLVIGYGLAAWRHRDNAAAFRQFAPLAILALFGLLLLAKIALVPRIIHYGFVLAMPATVLAVAALLRHVPELICRRWQGGTYFRRAAAALVVADILGFALMSSANVPRKTLPLGEGADRMYTYSADTSAVGPALKELLAEMKTAPAEATLAAFPEGVMVNYLARMRNPTGYTNAMPPELVMYGEASYVAALQHTRPDYIVLIDKDMAEYGVGPFGSADFGGEILTWIRQHYQVRRTIGEVPFTGQGFGIQLLVPVEKTLTDGVSQ